MLHATHQRMTSRNPADVRMPLLLLLLPHRIIQVPSQHRHDVHIRYPYTGGLQRLKSLLSGNDSAAMQVIPFQAAAYQ